MTIAILTHPDNRGKVTSLLKMCTLEAQLGIPLKDVFLPKGLHNFPVFYDDKVGPKRWTGKWLRTSELPDDRFFTWVDDMTNPPSWAIFFGLVEKEYEYEYYLVDTDDFKQELVSEIDLCKFLKIYEIKGSI